jgi:hypothetical protein
VDDGDGGDGNGYGDGHNAGERWQQ